MLLPAVYKNLLSLDEAKIIILPEDAPINLGGIKKGIVFVMARWSGASQLAFRPLAKALSELYRLSNLDDVFLYVVDTDNANADAFFALVGDNPRGYGETYWVLNGKVVNKLSGYDQSDLALVKQYTDELVASA